MRKHQTLAEFIQSSKHWAIVDSEAYAVAFKLVGFQIGLEYAPSVPITVQTLRQSDAIADIVKDLFIDRYADINECVEDLGCDIELNCLYSYNIIACDGYLYAFEKRGCMAYKA